MKSLVFRIFNWLKFWLHYPLRNAKTLLGYFSPFSLQLLWCRLIEIKKKRTVIANIFLVGFLQRKFSWKFLGKSFHLWQESCKHLESVNLVSKTFARNDCVCKKLARNVDITRVLEVAHKKVCFSCWRGMLIGFPPYIATKCNDKCFVSCSNSFSPKLLAENLLVLCGKEIYWMARAVFFETHFASLKFVLCFLRNWIIVYITTV